MSRDYATLLDELDRGCIDPAGFSHRDHIGVSVEALRQDEFFAATKRIADGLRAVTVKASAPEKFNATVTLAFMSLIAERMETEEDPAAFIDKHPDLCAPDVIARLYPAGFLATPLARKVALLPR
jgi:hypothetical protein